MRARLAYPVPQGFPAEFSTLGMPHPIRIADRSLRRVRGDREARLRVLRMSPDVERRWGEPMPGDRERGLRLSSAAPERDVDGAQDLVDEVCVRQGRCEAQSCISLDERDLDQLEISNGRVGSSVESMLDPLDHPIVCQALQSAISDVRFVGVAPFEDRR